MAQRVLIRLRQKLDGNEAGSFLSTEGQVNFLIQSARDPKNLCRVFPGWQPWIWGYLLSCAYLVTGSVTFIRQISLCKANRTNAQEEIAKNSKQRTGWSKPNRLSPVIVILHSFKRRISTRGSLTVHGAICWKPKLSEIFVHVKMRWNTKARDSWSYFAYIILGTKILLLSTFFASCSWVPWSFLPVYLFIPLFKCYLYSDAL